MQESHQKPKTMNQEQSVGTIRPRGTVIEFWHSTGQIAELFLSETGRFGASSDPFVMVARAVLTLENEVSSRKGEKTVRA